MSGEDKMSKKPTSFSMVIINILLSSLYNYSILLVFSFRILISLIQGLQHTSVTKEQSLSSQKHLFKQRPHDEKIHVITNI